MGSDVKALLLGHVEPAEIEASLAAQGLQIAGYIDAAGSSRYTVKNSSGCHLGILWIFGRNISDHDGAETYDGERTVLSATEDLAHPLQELVAEFGGYFRSDDEAEFGFIDGRREVELGPRERLLVTLQRTLPARVAKVLLAAIEADCGYASDLVKAIEDLSTTQTVFAPAP